MQRGKHAWGAVWAWVLVPSAVLAHDMVPPGWRGQEGSTYQEWTFDDADNPAPPEFLSNPYGSASAGITVAEFGSGWRWQLSAMGTQTGYWDLGGVGVGGTGPDGSIVIDIDNRPLTTPDSWKEIWVQITYYEDINQAPIVIVPGATLSSQQTLLVEHISTGGDWKLDQSVWRIQPNPLHEQVVITADHQWGSIVDQVVVDTICLPEPAMLSKLLLGGALALRRR